MGLPVRVDAVSDVGDDTHVEVATGPRHPVGLTIPQPWAHSIISGGCRTINRDYPTEFRGRFYIHVPTGLGRDEIDEWRRFTTGRGIDTRAIDLGTMQLGGIIGMATLCACDPYTPSRGRADRWFVATFGWRLVDVEPIDFVPLAKPGVGFFALPKGCRVPWRKYGA